MAAVHFSQLFKSTTTLFKLGLQDIPHFFPKFTVTYNNLLFIGFGGAVSYCVYLCGPLLLSYGNSLRNIPWKNGIPFFSYKDFHEDNEGFVGVGHEKLGSIFAFRFMQVCFYWSNFY